MKINRISLSLKTHIIIEAIKESVFGHEPRRVKKQPPTHKIQSHIEILHTR